MTLEEYIHEYLNYNPNTGVVRWIKSPANNIKIGDFAGSAQKGGFRIHLQKNKYLVSRVIWFMYYGEWPEKWIDHKDTDCFNNIITNLREATPQQNAANANFGPNKGVTQVNPHKFRARIRFNDKSIHIGYFDSKTEANEAYFLKAQELFGEFAHA